MAATLAAQRADDGLEDYSGANRRYFKRCSGNFERLRVNSSLLALTRGNSSVALAVTAPPPKNIKNRPWTTPKF
jgi:hypothetical protein